MSDQARTLHARYSGRQETDDTRVAFGIDCDRITYSSAFRRLNGVTQVVSADETALFHNRLTHSLKVAQVAIRIAHKVRFLMNEDPAIKATVDRYGGLDPRVVRAASLAHDLGHPPFGHIAERELQKLLKPEDSSDELHSPKLEYRLDDSFEGNAQSFRIVTRLAFREAGAGSTSAALDLTRATLRAILKYPWKKKEDLPLEDAALTEKRRRKWGCYDSEFEILKWACGSDRDERSVQFSGSDHVEYRTIEAQIMDLADDITYALHDLEDFYRAGLIPLHMLHYSPSEFSLFFERAWPRMRKVLGERIEESSARKILGPMMLSFPQAAYSGSRTHREHMHRLASAVIERTLDGLRVREPGYLLTDINSLTIIEAFKEMTWYYVIKRAALSSAQRGQALLIRNLYHSLLEWVLEEAEDLVRIAEGSQRFEPRQFPARLLDYLKVSFDPNHAAYSGKQRVSRAVVDYIVSLTEAQAVALGARLSGTSQRSMIEGWLQT